MAATVAQNPAVAGDSLSCTYEGYSDADGDADLSTFAWTVNDAPAGTGATLEGGFVGAGGYGLEENRQTRLPLVALGLKQSAAWEIHRRISLLAQVASGLQFIRPEVEVDDVGVVFARAPVDFRLSLGPSFHF